MSNYGNFWNFSYLQFHQSINLVQIQIFNAWCVFQHYWSINLCNRILWAALLTQLLKFVHYEVFHELQNFFCLMTVQLFPKSFYLVLDFVWVKTEHPFPLFAKYFRFSKLLNSGILFSHCKMYLHLKDRFKYCEYHFTFSFKFWEFEGWKYILKVAFLSIQYIEPFSLNACLWLFT